MTHPGLSTHVGVVETEGRRAGSLVVRQIGPATNLMGSTIVEKLFDNAGEAERESGALAEPLARVSEQVALQEAALRERIPNATADALEPSLTLSEPQSRELLKALRRGGSALREGLTGPCIDAFKSHDFLTGEGDEPSLNFHENSESPHVLWDLMYEGGTVGDVKWESFWGFRVPIAHWVFLSRTARISLRGRLFGGIDEGLAFAAPEIDAVAKRLNRSDACHYVSDYFKRYVRKNLVDAKLTDEQADAWLAGAGREWLEEYLSSGAGAPADSEQWKLDKLVETLRNTDADFDVLHFACHSTADAQKQSESALKMSVGGEILTLDVAAIISNLRIKITGERMPGPFVFLNACRMAETRQPFQPPPLATSWINHRGALAVISAVCPVPDYFAHAFALKYYDFLFGDADATFAGAPVKGSLAGALLATRRYFMETHRNPLGLAYILYASPGAHIAMSAR